MSPSCLLPEEPAGQGLSFLMAGSLNPARPSDMIPGSLLMEEYIEFSNRTDP